MNLTTTAVNCRLTGRTEASLPAAAPTPNDPKQVEKAARDLVGRAFFRILISAMRKTVPEGGILSGGRGEEVFQDLMDQRVAESLAARQEFPMTRVLVEQLLNRAGKTMNQAKGVERGWEA